MYSKSKSVLELEYFGEAGSGLGPTLEFFTLLSHELQRRDLSMWRHEDAEEADPAGATHAVQPVSGGDAAAVQQDAVAGKNKEGAKADVGAGDPEMDKRSSKVAGDKTKEASSTAVAAAGADSASGTASRASTVAAAAAAAATAQSAAMAGAEMAGGSWHDEAPDMVNAPWGLFPRPLHPSQRTSPAGIKVGQGRSRHCARTQHARGYI